MIDTRAGLLGASQMLDELAFDRYTFMRDAYITRRRSLVYDGNPPDLPDEDSDDDAKSAPAPAGNGSQGGTKPALPGRARGLFPGLRRAIVERRRQPARRRDGGGATAHPGVAAGPHAVAAGARRRAARADARVGADAAGAAGRPGAHPAAAGLRARTPEPGGRARQSSRAVALHVSLHVDVVNQFPAIDVMGWSDLPLERTRMFQRTISSLIFAAATLGATAAFAQTAPDAMIKQVAGDVIESVKNDKAIQAGDVGRIQGLVDTQVMPHVDFQRMTAATVGRAWKTATPDQQAKLQAEFKTLLIRTYAGALTKVNAQTSIELKPSRNAAEDGDVTVRTAIKGTGGDPIEIDYKLEKQPSEWKIFDVNVLGVWLVDQYKSSFQQQIASGGVDGLINALVAKNKAPAAAK